jgi:hypothetical protein
MMTIRFYFILLDFALVFAGLGLALFHGLFLSIF